MNSLYLFSLIFTMIVIHIIPFALELPISNCTWSGLIRAIYLNDYVILRNGNSFTVLDIGRNSFTVLDIGLNEPFCCIKSGLHKRTNHRRSRQAVTHQPFFCYFQLECNCVLLYNMSVNISLPSHLSHSSTCLLVYNMMLILSIGDILSSGDAPDNS